MDPHPVSEATQEPITETLPPVDAPSAVAAPAPPPMTQRDVQRAALRDLVSLATECATTESEIEHTFHAAVEHANKDLETTLWSLQQRLLSAEDSVRYKYDERL